MQLQFGNPAHILLVRETALRALVRKQLRLCWARRKLESVDGLTTEPFVLARNQEEYDWLGAELDSVQIETDALQRAIIRLHGEMSDRTRYIVRPLPYEEPKVARPWWCEFIEYATA